MATKTTRFNCTKALALVALLACIHEVSSAPMMKGVVHNSQTLDTMNMASNDDVAAKRFLRSSEAIMTGGHTEERRLGMNLPGLEQATSGIKSALTKLIQKLKLKWWGLRKKSPDEVFTLLKLGQTGDKLFENPGFSQWVSFVTVRSQNSEMIIFSTLVRHYPDDALAKMFISAKRVESSKDMATKLQNIQLTNWAHADKSADDVFKILKLNQAEGNILANPAFSTWTTYLAKIKKENPDTYMVAKLSDSFGDVVVAKMIASGMKVDSTANLAADLRTAQFKTWLDQGSTPTTINSLLGLSTSSDDLTKKVSYDFEKFYGKAVVVDKRPSTSE